MAHVPLFSVVIPTFGRPQFLADAVASVLAQTVPDFEVIIVDDHSPEPVAAPSADPRIRIERLPANAGPAAARNAGVRVARGTYVVMLDDDDLMTPERLALAQRGLARAPVALCWSRVLGAPAGTASGRMLEGDIGAVIRDGLTPHLGQTALRRDAFLPFDEDFPASQDVEWWLRMAQVHRVATVPEVGLLYRVHSGLRNRNGPAERVEALTRMMELHADYFAAHPRARAFQLKRIGLTALSAGQRRVARRSLAAALRARPEAATAWHLVRAVAARGN